MVDEEMEALCDIDFPISDKSSSQATENDDLSKHHVGKDDGRNSSSTTANNNKPVDVKVVDEDAIIRCFDLSIKSHVDGIGTVPVFEPLPPQKNDNRSTPNSSIAKK